MINEVYYKGKILSEDFYESNAEKIRVLLQKWNIKKNDIVICKADSDLGVYIQYLASLQFEFIPVFISCEFTNQSIQEIVNRIDVTALLECKGMEYEISVFSDRAHNCHLGVAIEAGSVIHVTSATTGIPKLVLRTYQQLDSELSRYAKYLNITENDVILPIVPLYHSFGFISGMMLSMKTHAKLVLPDVILPRNIIQLCNQYHVTMLLGVTYFYRKMLGLADRYSLNLDLRYVISSGGPMEQGLQSDFMDAFGIKLLQQYGSTETGSLAIGYSEKSYQCVGKEIPGAEITCEYDGEGRPCVYVSSKDTIGVYLTEDGITELNGSHYKMGDVGRVNQDGEIEILGRSDDILINNGKKIDKKFVISIIRNVAHVKDADIYLKRQNATVELICEYCSDVNISKNHFVDFSKAFLANYQIPQHFYRVDRLTKQKRKTWKSEYQ